MVVGGRGVLCECVCERVCYKKVSASPTASWPAGYIDAES